MTTGEKSDAIRFLTDEESETKRWKWRVAYVEIDTRDPANYRVIVTLERDAEKRVFNFAVGDAVELYHGGSLCEHEPVKKPHSEIVVKVTADTTAFDKTIKDAIAKAKQFPHLSDRINGLYTVYSIGLVNGTPDDGVHPIREVNNNEKETQPSFKDDARILAQIVGVNKSQIKKIETVITPSVADVGVHVHFDDGSMEIRHVGFNRFCRAKLREAKIRDARKDYNANVTPYREHLQKKVAAYNNAFRMVTAGLRDIRDEAIAKANHEYNEGK